MFTDIVILVLLCLVVDVCWESTFLFFAAYASPSKPTDQPSLVHLNVPKTGAPTYVSYDDVCFASDVSHSHHYHMQLVPSWWVKHSYMTGSVTQNLSEYI